MLYSDTIPWGFSGEFKRKRTYVPFTWTICGESMFSGIPSAVVIHFQVDRTSPALFSVVTRYSYLEKGNPFGTVILIIHHDSSIDSFRFGNSSPIAELFPFSLWASLDKSGASLVRVSELGAFPLWGNLVDNRTTHQPIDQSTNQSIKQSINQSIDQSINRSIGRSPPPPPLA